MRKWLGGWFGLFVVKQGEWFCQFIDRFSFIVSVVLLSPFQIYPLVGMIVTAWFKALGTSRFLHRRVSLFCSFRTLTRNILSVCITVLPIEENDRRRNCRLHGGT